jgi:hypothetical protein
MFLGRVRVAVVGALAGCLRGVPPIAGAGIFRAVRAMRRRLRVVRVVVAVWPFDGCGWAAGCVVADILLLLVVVRRRRAPFAADRRAA